MLTRVRIEVEEETAEACVEALWKYEHAIVQQEVRRYRRRWPIHISSEGPAITEEDEYPTPDQSWHDPVESRHWFNAELGREVTEEVIEYDGSVPGYRGRRVIRFARLDTRSTFIPELHIDMLAPGDAGLIKDDSGETIGIHYPRNRESELRAAIEQIEVRE